MPESIFGLRTRRCVAALALAGVAALGGCDFGDPTDVDNPSTTTEDLAQADQPTRALLNGVRTQFARALAAASTLAGVVSDDYSIHGTGLQKDWDAPRDIDSTLGNSTGTATGVYWNTQELRALAQFVLDEIVPEDPDARANQIAEAHFWRGMAFLMQAEFFSALPTETDGSPVGAQALLDRAVADFQQGQGATNDVGLMATAALARALRLQGDVGGARAAAMAALGGSGSFAFIQEYDASTLSNTPFFFLVLRELQEMQPLPRLDFLDPKFLTRESGIAFAKAEEMYLILAEADFADGNYAAGRENLARAIELAQTRTEVEFNDDDLRLNADLSIRPRDSRIEIRADASSPFRAGLVLDRPGVIMAPIISDTSLDPDSIRGIPAGDTMSLLHALYLARQEIMLLEGRRLADLGIQLPMMRDEIDANQTISPGDPGTTVVVPSYIPPVDEMDLFTPQSPFGGTGSDAPLVTTEVTMLWDMNKMLAMNRAPFTPVQ